MFDIQENLKKLPDCPGVYIHRDRLGNIIYVGKAISLRNRVRQYFQSSRNMDPKVRSMVSQIAEFEYIRTGSEVEALLVTGEDGFAKGPTRVGKVKDGRIELVVHARSAVVLA